MGRALILAAAFLFVTNYLLHSTITQNPKQASSEWFLSRAPPEAPNLIKVFYNLFVARPEDTGRVLAIFNEQIQTIDPNIHDVNISINSIGHWIPYVPKQYTIEHCAEGGEDMTLHSLWGYCKANNSSESKVVYLHSKGSYHPDENNSRLRRFLTEGALSEECANSPNNCDVCSSRMSTHPHPHTSGNMWLARCSYINKLIDPYTLREGKLPNIYNKDNGCMGFGRYFFEHWVYSHPTVRPCDLYPGKEYTWAYENIPGVNFVKELKLAPRFEFQVFIDLLIHNYWYCRNDKSSQSMRSFLKSRKWSYRQLYNITVLPESWYLWDFLNGSSVQ